MRVALLLAALLVCGCNQILGVGDVHLGHDGGIDAPPGTIDARPGTIDAPHLPIDAPGPDAGPNVSTKLGKHCVASSDCPTVAQDCISIGGGPMDMFCTLSCGTTASMTPPSNGDATCAAQYDAPSGTPACVLYTMSGATYNWECAIECGTNGTSNFGTCPVGLQCVSNICQ